MSESSYDKIKKGLEQSHIMAKCDHDWQSTANPNHWLCPKCKGGKWDMLNEQKDD